MAARCSLSMRVLPFRQEATRGRAFGHPPSNPLASLAEATPSLIRQIAFMENPERCGKALRKDVSAATTLGPNASRRQLWADLAGKAGYPDPFFLQPSMIYEVMGALKLAGFRSAQLYLDVAKAQHISQGHMWSDQLQQSYRAAVRSCQRFLGSPKQAAPLPLDKLALKSRWPREAPFGPHGHHCWLAGGFSGR